MDHLLWQHRPELRRPALVAAFDGWNDAGEAATIAVRHLAGVLGATPFADIDGEEFHDFTESRPQVSLSEGLIRHIDWPEHRFSAATVAGAERDIVLLTAVEPQLRWRTYTAVLLEVVTTLGCELVLTLGSLLADTPHTRPVRITGTVATPDLAVELGLTQSRYEGPTGIVGVFHDALRTAGVRSASLWASVPHYVGRSPSPAAALALVQRAAPLLGIEPDTTALQIDAAQYLAEIDEAVRGDDDALEYVRTLEEHADEDDDDEPDALEGGDDGLQGRPPTASTSPWSCGAWTSSPTRSSASSASTGTIDEAPATAPEVRRRARRRVVRPAGPRRIGRRCRRCRRSGGGLSARGAGGRRRGRPRPRCSRARCGRWPTTTAPPWST